MEARRVLQLAALVLRAGHAPVDHVDVAQADVLRPAQVDPVARETAVRVLRQQQVQRRVAHLHGIAALGVHHHAVAHRQRAGRRRPALALDLDDTHTARAVRLHAGVVAEVRDVDAGVVRRLHHHLAGLGRDLPPVYRDRDLVSHVLPCFVPSPPGRGCAATPCG